MGHASFQTGFTENSNTLQNLPAINIVTSVQATDLVSYITLFAALGGHALSPFNPFLNETHTLLP